MRRRWMRAWQRWPDSKKVAILGNPRPPMMDGKRPLAAPGPVTRLAEATVPYPDPFAMATEEAPIEPVSSVAAPAEATRRDRPVPADPTPQVPLPLTRGWRLRHRLSRRHPRTPFLAGLLDQRQITPTDLRHLIPYANVQNKRRCEKTQKSLRPA
jgi:hypothetical protein